jgi:indole-3-glycerol phosphate synthase
MTESRLDSILESTRRRITELHRLSSSVLENEAKDAPAPRSFLEAVREPPISLIAEIKRRSPSAGDIDRDTFPADRAAAYEAGGARALSVLTEPDFFLGSAVDLSAAKEASALPVLRKDFIIDPVQVIESRSWGADAVLLIVQVVDSSLLKDLINAT